MEWAQVFGQDNKPTFKEIDAFIDSSLWPEINQFLRESYKAEPELGYSACSAQPGWNVKYRKSGKSLCTLYPMEGYFIALVVIGGREQPEAELSMPLCSEYTRELFGKTVFSAGGRWLMINVTSPEILEDVKLLVQLRRKIR